MTTKDHINSVDMGVALLPALCLENTTVINHVYKTTNLYFQYLICTIIIVSILITMVR